MTEDTRPPLSQPDTPFTDQIPSHTPPAGNGNGGRRKQGAILLTLLLVAGIASIIWFLWSANRITTDNAFVEGTIHPVASKVPGLVMKVHVVENQRVKKGDLLVELDPTDYQVRESAARAALELAMNDTSGDEPRIRAMEAEVAQARSRLAQAEIDLARYRRLAERDVVPLESVEKLETARNIERERLAEREATLARIRAELGATGESGKKARIDLRRSDLDDARLKLSYTRIVAPADGYVTRKGVEVGAYIQPGQPLMTVVDLDHAWVTANYKERQLTHVKPGDPVTFTVDTYPGITFQGKVESIMAGTGAAFSLFPPENATGNYVKVVQRIPVRISIDSRSDPLHTLRVGMSIVPTIHLHRPVTEIIRDLFPFLR